MAKAETENKEMNRIANTKNIIDLFLVTFILLYDRV